MILQRLFHTEFYKRIEERLRVEASELKKMVERQILERTSQLRQLHTVGDEGLMAALKEEVPNDAVIIPLVSEIIEMMEKSLSELKFKVEKTQLNRDELQKGIVEGEAIHRQLKAKIHLQAQKANLESEKDDFEGKKHKIIFAYKAARLHQQEELCHRLRKDFDEAAKGLERVNEQKELIEKGLKEAERAFEEEEKKDDERKKAAEEISSFQT